MARRYAPNKDRQLMTAGNAGREAPQSGAAPVTHTQALFTTIILGLLVACSPPRSPAAVRMGTNPAPDETHERMYRSLVSLDVPASELADCEELYPTNASVGGLLATINSHSDYGCSWCTEDPSDPHSQLCVTSFATSQGTDEAEYGGVMYQVRSASIVASSIECHRMYGPVEAPFRDGRLLQGSDEHCPHFHRPPR